MATYLDSSDEEDAVFEIETEEREKSAPFVNDIEGLHEKRSEFAWTSTGTFNERLEVTAETPIDVDDVDDDLQRELSFYQQALAAVKYGIRALESEGVPWLRPEDYYAEMVKSDQHLARIKSQLLYEQKRIALAEERRKSREAKKFAKQVQAVRQQEKQSAKKDKTRQTHEIRTQRKRMGFGEEFDWDRALEEVHHTRKRPPRHKNVQQSLPVVKSGKRLYKDAKYGRSGGFGPSRQRKGNSAETSGDMRLFRTSGGGGGGGVEKRLGKRRRMAQKANQKSRHF